MAFNGLGNDGVTAAGTANDFHVLPSEPLVVKQEEPFPSAKVGVSCELANGLKLFSENFLFPWVAQLGEEMCLLLLPS